MGGLEEELVSFAFGFPFKVFGFLCSIGIRGKFACGGINTSGWFVGDTGGINLGFIVFDGVSVEGS